MSQRVTQDAALTLAIGTPKQRVTQDASLTLGQGTPKIRVTQLACLVLADAPPPSYPGGGNALLEFAMP